jgi:hypothetical protein
VLPEPLLLGVFVRGAALTIALVAGATGAPPIITYRNTVPLPGSTTDQFGAPFTIAGLSGLAYSAGDEFIAVMDNSSKLVRLRVTVSGNGTVMQAAVLGGITLAQTHDFEGVALDGTGGVYLSEEDTPAVRRFNLSDGAVLGAPDDAAGLREHPPQQRLRIPGAHARRRHDVDGQRAGSHVGRPRGHPDRGHLPSGCSASRAVRPPSSSRTTPSPCTARPSAAPRPASAR